MTHSAGSSLESRVDQLFRSLRAKFPNSKIDPDTADEWLSDMIDDAKELGLERWEAGFVLARRWVRDENGTKPRIFIPNPEEIRSFVPAAEPKTKFADQNCAECGGSGQVVREGFARTCACKLR